MQGQRLVKETVDQEQFAVFGGPDYAPTPEGVYQNMPLRTKQYFTFKHVVKLT